MPFCFKGFIRVQFTLYTIISDIRVLVLKIIIIYIFSDKKLQDIFQNCVTRKAAVLTLYFWALVWTSFMFVFYRFMDWNFFPCMKFFCYLDCNPWQCLSWILFAVLFILVFHYKGVYEVEFFFSFFTPSVAWRWTNLSSLWEIGPQFCLPLNISCGLIKRRFWDPS